jgi:hypothetical protein
MPLLLTYRPAALLVPPQCSDLHVHSQLFLKIFRADPNDFFEASLEKVMRFSSSALSLQPGRNIAPSKPDILPETHNGQRIFITHTGTLSGLLAYPAHRHGQAFSELSWRKQHRATQSGLFDRGLRLIRFRGSLCNRHANTLLAPSKREAYC